MHLPTIRNKRRVQARFDDQQTRLVPPPARELAIAWLVDKIAEGEAGVDPYDVPVFIIQARQNERAWTRTVIELCGLYLSDTGGEYRLILEADVRERLGCTGDNPPAMPDVALASRGADSGLTSLLDAVHGPPKLQVVADEPAGVVALHEARAAYERSVH